jgi:hypothetical protein
MDARLICKSIGEEATTGKLSRLRKSAQRLARLLFPSVTGSTV